MKEEDINNSTVDWFLPEPQRSVINAALSNLVKNISTGKVVIEKYVLPDGRVTYRVEQIDKS